MHGHVHIANTKGAGAGDIALLLLLDTGPYIRCISPSILQCRLLNLCINFLTHVNFLNILCVLFCAAERMHKNNASSGIPISD